MFLDRQLEKYLVHEDATLIATLRKIDATKGRIMMVVDAEGHLRGVVTNGDILRWLIDHPSPDLDSPVGEVANAHYRFVGEDASTHEIEILLEEVLFVPVVDSDGRVTAVARRGLPESGIRIGDRWVGPGHPCFVVAEIGNNHNGSVERAQQLVDAAVKAGADCAKFQMRQMNELYAPGGDGAENLGTEYTLDLLSRFQLSNDELFEMFDYCRARGIQPLCTPWDEASLALLEETGMEAYKVASADLTNHRLLRAVAATGKPVLCSTGMSTEEEIVAAVRLLREAGAAYVLLHCNSTYPAPFGDIQLRYLSRLREIGGCPTGYSGHERDIHVSLAAVALGADVVERHVTLDRSLEGADHKASLLPGELADLVRGIRQVEKALGREEPRRLSQGEMINRVTLAKSLVAACDIPAGTRVTDEMVSVRSPGRGLQPMYLPELLGQPTRRALKAGDCFFPSDLRETTVERRGYRFRRPWGIPVRFHDYRALTRGIEPDLVEFHLSYRDLDVDFTAAVPPGQPMDLVVHCPELFAGDHLLDLCAADPAYRARSIAELERVIEVTRALAGRFRTTGPTRLITNVGGFSLSDFLPEAERALRLERLHESLDRVSCEDVEILPQTMPPFPWHFGGQRHHNLFVTAEDIVSFCRERRARVCFDVSHSKLACIHHRGSFFEFAQRVGPHTAHLHVADSRGRAGEGLQIGEGEIDFRALAEVLDEVCPDASFVPEVWQGHENDGEGFWVALDRLERVFGG